VLTLQLRECIWVVQPVQGTEIGEEGEEMDTEGMTGDMEAEGMIFVGGDLPRLTEGGEADHFHQEETDIKSCAQAFSVNY